MGAVASKAHVPSWHERDPWVPASYSRETLREALLDAGIAGVNSHDRPNVLWKIKRLAEDDPTARFGLSRVDEPSPEEVLRLVAEASGISPDPNERHGLVIVDPDKVIDAATVAGDRLASAARAGVRILIATGHPSGLLQLYQEIGRLLEGGGAKLLRPLEGFTWEDDDGGRRRRRQIRYFRGVAVLTDRASSLHTHSPDPMERMLEEADPDLVLADHGFAGAAIEAGIDTVSVADVNDPALVVARAQGRAGPVIVMDDNVQPETYWPVLQVIVSRFDANAG
ncbi:MAG TPA: phosphatase, partial [Actinomycetota bacterium]|nr:phosphatase [Actinomycetota bacterium]